MESQWQEKMGTLEVDDPSAAMARCTMWQGRTSRRLRKCLKTLPFEYIEGFECGCSVLL